MTLESAIGPRHVPPTRPPLVIVSGAPGSGKSTLARELGRAVHLPLIERDQLKERLADELLPADADPDIGVGGIDSAALGRAAYAILFLVTDRLLDSGVGAIVESNFRRGISEPELEPRVARSHAVLVHCQASAALVVERYVTRFEMGSRHRVHRDLGRLEALQEDLANGRFEPLEFAGVPVIQVDTSSGYDPPLASVLDRVRSVLGSAIG